MCSRGPIVADLSTTIAHWALSSGQPVTILDALDDEQWQNRESVVALELRAVMSVPLRVGSEVRGLLYLDSRDPQVAFEARDLDAAERLGALLALGLQG